MPHRIGVVLIMKIKIKYLIIGLILICLAGIYSFVDKTVSIYDTKVDTNDFQSVTLEQGKDISQTFLCDEEYLDGVSLKIAADNVPDNNQVIMDYKLLEGNSGRQVANGEVTLENLKSGSFFKIGFDRVSNCKGKEYTFELSLKECPTGNIRLFYTFGNIDNTKLTYGQEKIEGVQVMRTLTHGFDVETFIVTVCFVAYIIIFMRWLYKLFE